jgi:hypothetical protein
MPQQAGPPSPSHLCLVVPHREASQRHPVGAIAQVTPTPATPAAGMVVTRRAAPRCLPIGHTHVQPATHAAAGTACTMPRGEP